MITLGSLASGYGGLEMGVGMATGATTAWLCENDVAPSHLLAMRHPHLHNYGDIKALEWAEQSVDILTAGYPCTPFSGAGKRGGTEDPRHLWPWIAQGIARSRPPTVLLENVRGHLSLGWDTVLCDLHRLGYDVRWTLLRAADVGAAHNRTRLFAVAADRDAHRWDAPTGWPVARITDETLNAPHDGLFGAHPLPLAENGHVPMWPAGLMIGGVVWEQDALLGTAQYELLPTPRTSDTNGAGEHGTGGLDLRTAVDMLPTPTARNWKGTGPHDVDKDTGPSLSALPLLLPTPCAHDSGNTPEEHLRKKPGRTVITSLQVLADHDLLSEAALTLPTTDPQTKGERWGRYADAVARCEALTRPAPDPTLPSGKGGAHRLSPAFVEWLMMLPAGWVTDPDLWTHLTAGAARNAQLKLLGNGCVTAQAAAAWRHLTAGLLVV